MKKIFVLSLSVLFVLIISCSDKDYSTVNTPADLLGSWSQNDEQTQGIIKFTYTFNGDASYVYKVDFYGFNGKPKTEFTDSSEDSGTFEVEGDSLFLKRPGYEGAFKSKFWVKNDVLHLKYISYPADAPVLTHMEYGKVD